MAYNRSKAIWGPDADEFKPERWLPSSMTKTSSEADDKTSHPYNHGWNGQFTFAYGTRMCLGLRLGMCQWTSLVSTRANGCLLGVFPALFEYKAILSALVQAFETIPDSLGRKIDLYISSTGVTQPFVKGTRGDTRPQVPLGLRTL